MDLATRSLLTRLTCRPGMLYTHYTQAGDVVTVFARLTYDYAATTDQRGDGAWQLVQRNRLVDELPDDALAIVLDD